MPELRDLPSVDQLLQTQSAQEWAIQFGRSLTTAAIRGVLDRVRARFPQVDALPLHQEILEQVKQQLQIWTTPSLSPVINATGVILHTNLGRAPLCQAAVQAMQAVGGEYSNLEYDLEQGKRGSRLIHAEGLLKNLTGAEAALVVNNNAAAVLLVLSALARRRNVLIARSQLVEIGGGFRVPEVMKQSGAHLLEVGATNRVHASDYEGAIQDEKIALVMHVHRSNFRISGFTSEPTLTEIASIAHRAGIPVVDDLGSGALLDTSQYGLSHEPTVTESLAGNADLVCFSGDKLLGGPQAGIIVGRADLIHKLKAHPLARALRADKLCLAALSATLIHYLKGEAEREIPIWRMIACPLEDIKKRAQDWANHLGQGSVLPSQSTVGGGSLPEEMLPTFTLSLSPSNPNRFVELLRKAPHPIIARLENNQVLLDPRTVLLEQDPVLLNELRHLLAGFRNEKS